MPPIPLLTALLKHLDERGGSVGLLRRPLPLPLSHSHLWVAPYAFLLLTWISPESPPIRREHLEQLWLEGEAAVQRLLRTLPGGLRDPYLLLALSTPPPTTLLSTIRELESNPLVCRKQVLWPHPDPARASNPWAPMVDGVTCMGLPTAAEHLHARERDPLPPPEAALVQRLKRDGIEACVRHHEQQAGTREDQHVVG